MQKKQRGRHAGVLHRDGQQETVLSTYEYKHIYVFCIVLCRHEHIYIFCRCEVIFCFVLVLFVSVFAFINVGFFNNGWGVRV